MRKMMNEQLPISKSSPLKARFYDYPYFTYPWHFHTEYEIIYVKEGTIPVETGVDQITSFLQLLKEMANVASRSVLSTSDFENDIIYDGSRIDKIIVYLNKNYTRQIYLNEISSLAAMNPAAFCRFFKSKTGKSFKNYILEMRIGYACKLLLMGDMNISQISVECGFDTISHFNKSFKKHTGFTPSYYKKMMLAE